MWQPGGTQPKSSPTGRTRREEQSPNYPRSKEVHSLKAAPRFPISVTVAQLRTLISDLHNFPRRDFTRSLVQGETHSGWRSCRGKSTATLGRDGSSIVIADFIRGAEMSWTSARFSLSGGDRKKSVLPAVFEELWKRDGFWLFQKTLEVAKCRHHPICIIYKMPLIGMGTVTKEKHQK